MNKEEWFENHKIITSAVSDLLMSTHGSLTIEAIEAALPKTITATRGDIMSAIVGLIQGRGARVVASGFKLSDGKWSVAYECLEKSREYLPGYVSVFYDYDKDVLLKVENDCSEEGFVRFGEIEQNGNEMFVMTLVKQ